MYESDDKMVSHPSHYQSKTGLEVIDVIEAFTYNLSGIEATDTGNVIKYICRWKQKNGIQDLKKAMWYLQHLIDHFESFAKDENVPYDFVRCGYCGKIIQFDRESSVHNKEMDMRAHLWNEHGITIKDGVSIEQVIKIFTKERTNHE